MWVFGDAERDSKDAPHLQKDHIDVDVGQVPYLNLTLRMLANVFSCFLNIYSNSP